MDKVITSRDNATIKLAAGLAARKKERDETSLFLAEGLRLCLDAAGSGVVIQTLLVTEEAVERHPEIAQLQQYARNSMLISPALCGRVSDTKTPQGVFAICEKLDNTARMDKMKKGGRYLLLANIQDPGNVGTMLRTADAMAVDSVFLSADCADLYSPKLLRGSMGSVFRLPVLAADDLPRRIARLREAGVPVWAAALTESAVPADSVDFSEGGAVLIGNEGNGLPEDLISACTGSIIIPMAQGANSLNAAVAAGILLWEMRRRNDGGNRG